MKVRNQAIKKDHQKGYRVSDCGTMVEYKGKTRKLQVKIKFGKPYHRFSVSVEGKSTNIQVHRLQAYQKYKGKVFQEGIVVRHRDDNSLNNCKKNILIGTQAQNMKDKGRNFRRR